MLRICVIFSLHFVASLASGEFSVITSPNSISFTGSDALQSQYVGDVLNAAVGNSIPGDAQWTGMAIVDPFNLAKDVIAIFVDGVTQISMGSTAKTYPMTGNDADDSLNVISLELAASNTALCDVNYIEEDVANYRSCTGEVDVSAMKVKSLNPALHSGDKQFLHAIGSINAFGHNFPTVHKTGTFVFFRLSLEPVSRAHGEKSEAMAEATNLITATISELKTAIQKSSQDNVLLVVITNKWDGGRYKRQASPATNTSDTKNFAAPKDFYDEDYPVIFNIILWFMVSFAFALLAICYAIGTMDPGRDSIIYRMTSTRMKKDN